MLPIFMVSFVLLKLIPIVSGFPGYKLSVVGTSEAVITGKNVLYCVCVVFLFFLHDFSVTSKPLQYDYL